MLEQAQNLQRKTPGELPDPAYVIGGGPSLKGFDFERLRGRPCYAANKSGFDTPWGQLISIDRDFCFNFRDLIASFGDRAHLAPPDNIADLNPLARHYRRSKARTIFDGPGDDLPGLNSGFAAFAKAIRDGHRRIALLGIDMRTGTGHYHGGYAWNPNQIDGITREWIADFDRAAEECAQRGIEVINFSIDSAVTSFSKMPLDRLFSDIFQEKG
jgi:hypothetical protein